MAFNSLPSRLSKRKPDDAALLPLSKRDGATRLHHDPGLVQEEPLQLAFTPVQLEPFVSSFDSLSLTPALLRLPNELLDVVASFLTPTTTVHLMEGIGLAYNPKENRSYTLSAVQSAVSKRYKRQLSDLRHFALVCRRFRPMAERHLYNNISLPHTTPRRYAGFVTPSNDSLFYLARTLFARPDLAYQVQSLQLWLQDLFMSRFARNSGYNTLEEAHKLVKNMFVSRKVTFAEFSVWMEELQQCQEIALQAIVIYLLPRLEHIEINGPTSCPRLWRWLPMSFAETAQNSSEVLSYLGVALRRSPALVSIHLNIPFRVLNLPVANLTNLTLDVLYFGDRLDLLHKPSTLPSVQKLTITLNLVLMRGQYFDRVFPKLNPKDGIRLFLQNVVPNVSRFAIESPRGTMPYGENQTDRRGNKLSALDMDQPLDIEYNPLSRWSDPGTWDWLLDALFPVKHRILSLSLPPNWYSSNGQHVKAIPSLQHLEQLVALQVPHVAVVSNRLGLEFDAEKHHTEVTRFLPKSLEILVITQVDIDTGVWLRDAFVKHHLLPNLKSVYLFFRDDYEPNLPVGFKEDVIESGVRVFGYWKGQSMAL